MDEVRIDAIASGVYVATRALEEGLDVRAALLLGKTKALVIDTMTRPEDMTAFAEIARAANLPVTVALTHADWDHAWGTAAFPNATIVAHSICYDRLKSRAAREELERRRRDGSTFHSVRLLKPTATFDSQMTIDAGDLDVELYHLPGHTADSIVAFAPQLRMLFAGDCVESPFPLLESGPLEVWAAGLRAWAARGVSTVVPAHGAIAGSELLLSNAAYLESLPSAPAPAADLLPFYAAAHARNVAAAARLREGHSKT